jgi:hypothetical protein
VLDLTVKSIRDHGWKHGRRNFLRRDTLKLAYCLLRARYLQPALLDR